LFFIFYSFYETAVGRFLSLFFWWFFKQYIRAFPVPPIIPEL